MDEVARLVRAERRILHLAARVVGCTGLARLDFWLGRVGTVEQAEGLFAMRPGEPPEKPALR
ncbi:hypothetical protein [Streptomyces olivaceus]|uniref:hypothetical protein n=1 Tax=Streptomyces olivaceus TaxID=47716 RepID=UPI001CCA44B4|nr:hypothetical protein [Streptomyces olivaceus]MBZ6228413.1 hypothetical protein [Streptomyces olivaceus]